MLSLGTRYADINTKTEELSAKGVLLEAHVEAEDKILEAKDVEHDAKISGLEAKDKELDAKDVEHDTKVSELTEIRHVVAGFSCYSSFWLTKKT